MMMPSQSSSSSPPPSSSLAPPHEATRIPICPTWSWASLQGAVAIDLVPDNSAGGLRVKSVPASVLGLPAWAADPNHDASATPQQGALVIRGPLCKVLRKRRRGKLWQIWARGGESVLWPRQSAAWFFPDLEAEVEGADDDDDDDDGSNLFCMAILELERSPDRKFGWGVRCEVRGLVLRGIGTSLFDGDGNNDGDDPSGFAFERAGLFTTTKMKLGRIGGPGKSF